MSFSSEIYISQIQHYLSTFDVENAIFLAERLLSEQDSPQIRYVLSLCYYQNKQISSAHRILAHSLSSLPNRFLFSQCCYELGHYSEGENALKDQNNLGASEYFLLARLAQKSQHISDSINYYKKCLELDPLRWSAYRALCNMGAIIPTEPLFNFSSLSSSFSFRTPQQPFDNEPPSSILLQPLNAFSPITPMPCISRLIHHTNDFDTPLSFPLVVSSDTEDHIRHPNTRRSLRLEHKQKLQNNNIPISPPPTRKKPPTSRGKSISAQKRALQVKQQITSNTQKPSVCPPTSLQYIFQILAKAYQHQCQYHCSKALKLYSSLPSCHYQTCWVQNQMGRCAFEICDYKASVTFYRQSFKLNHFQTQNLEYYSTSLWHLKDQIELSYIAQQTISLNRLSPYPYIVIGNCFSLQKEHETALKFFKRAIQLDPTLAYAYTLTAHEYLTNEDYDKAIDGYRYAIRLDPRHYNAWYGLGIIYYRQQKYKLSAFHFQQAIDINPYSSVLYCYLGMTLHALGKNQEALSTLNKGISLTPLNPLIQYQIAQVYYNLHQYEKSLEEALKVVEIAPKEASIHFLLGKIYQSLHQKSKSLLSYSRVLELDVKDRIFIQSMIDKLLCDINETNSNIEDDIISP